MVPICPVPISRSRTVTVHGSMEADDEWILSTHASRMREKSPIFVKPKLSITPIIAISSLVLT